MSSNYANNEDNEVCVMMKIVKCCVWVLLSLFLLWFCAGIGFGEWQMPSAMDETVQAIRLPRLINAVLVGSALATSGAALQALFDNPLADPSLIGTSSGAALGVITVLAFGVGSVGVPLAAFLGALLVCLLIVLIHRLIGGGTLGLLVLGFVLSAFAGAVVSVILFLSDDLVLRSASIWLAGSLAESGYTSPWYAGGAMALGLALLLYTAKRLDILMLGEDVAVSQGISVQSVRLQTIVGSALLTGAAVSLSGIIGFLGMIVPNIVAYGIGGRRRKIMILSAWIGGVFLLTVDSFARWVTYPIDVPVGIVIALLGAPFFMWLFLKPIRK